MMTPEDEETDDGRYAARWQLLALAFSIACWALLIFTVRRMFFPG